MHIEILVEEPSTEAALRHLLPKFSNRKQQPKIINMGSKNKLMRALPARLKAYQQRIKNGERLRIVVLVDRDTDDCLKLKEHMEKIAHDANLATKSAPDVRGGFTVLNRIVVEELESWFIGDPDALRKAFPSIPAIKPSARLFQNPDNGGSWEALHRFLKKHGVYRNSYPKIDAARKIATHMDIAKNRSKSFQTFVSGMKLVLV